MPDGAGEQDHRVTVITNPMQGPARHPGILVSLDPRADFRDGPGMFGDRKGKSRKTQEGARGKGHECLLESGTLPSVILPERPKAFCHQPPGHKAGHGAQGGAMTCPRVTRWPVWEASCCYFVLLKNFFHI